MLHSLRLGLSFQNLECIIKRRVANDLLGGINGKALVPVIRNAMDDVESAQFGFYTITQ